eukprot:266786-Chlamydomonas_euryale.AAC.1
MHHPLGSPVRGGRRPWRDALPGRGWGADGPERGRGRVALPATAARRSRDGSRFWRRAARRFERHGPETAGRGPATICRPV